MVRVMLQDVDAFLRYFGGVHKRTLRDVAALPPAAAAWRGPGELGEGLWSLGQIVGHIAGGRLMFGGAYAGRGWQLPRLPYDPADQAAWLPLLEWSASSLNERLAGTPAAWLERRLAAMDQSGLLVGWRVLMLLVEHEVHHRSQLDTYAGLEGWAVPDLFGLSFEQVRQYASDAP